MIKEIINTILLEGLSTYFFFDTERISTVSDRKDIRKAVNDFLGFSAIENAARHLGDRSKKNSVIGIFYSQMDFKGDKRAKEALDKIQSANDNRDAIAEQLQECANQIAHYEKIKAEIEQILRTHQATAELQKEIDELERKIQNEEESRAKAIEKYFKEFNASALPFFIFPLLNVADRFLKAVKIDDKGVRDITKTSIMELIERGHCICGREICEGNEAYRHLMDAIKYLPPESIGTTVRLYRERLKDFSRLSERVYGDIKEIHDRIAQSTAWIHGWEYDIEYKRKKIAGQENMSQRESELADIRRRLRELNEKKDRLNKEDGALARDIDHYQKFYDRLTAQSDKNREIQKYLDYAEEIKTWLELHCKQKECEIRENLENEVNTIFSEMYHGHRRVAIDEQYQVELMATVADTEIASGESEGANRVKNFSFIAGLVALAKKQILKDMKISSESYPLVMDAPFSNADEKHTAGISKVLPQIAEQIIMFVMQKDWKYAEPVIKMRLGQKYCLKKISETFTKIEEA